MSANIHVTDQPENDRYVVSLDGEVIGRADYVRRGDVVVIPHTQISFQHSGQGLGGQMVRYRAGGHPRPRSAGPAGLPVRVRLHGQEPRVQRPPLTHAHPFRVSS